MTWRLAKCTAGGYEVLDEELPAPTVKPISPHGGAPRFDDLIWLDTDAEPGTLVPRDLVGRVPYGEEPP